jgi:hypothetical protein
MPHILTRDCSRNNVLLGVKLSEPIIHTLCSFLLETEILIDSFRVLLNVAPLSLDGMSALLKPLLQLSF